MGFFLGYMMGSSNGSSGSRMYDKDVLEFMKNSYVEYLIYAVVVAFVATNIYFLHKKYKQNGTVPSKPVLMFLLCVLAFTPVLNYDAFSKFVASTFY